MSTTRHEVRHLDRITMTLPSNPATRDLGLANQQCDVTVGVFHARLHLDGGIVRKIKLHEAGIVGDPATGGLYIADASRERPILSEPAPVLMRTWQLVDLLDGCPRYANVVIRRLDRGRSVLHGIDQVVQRRSLVINRGDELVFHRETASVSPTSATIRVHDLRTYAANGDPTSPVVVLTGNRDAVHGVHEISLTCSRVVWLLTGKPIKTPGRIMSRLMAGFQS